MRYKLDATCRVADSMLDQDQPVGARLFSRIYQRLLGQPWVYERVRPLIIGGLDMRPAYENLEAGDDDVIVDVGCGTGDALNYLTRFRAYHGFDTDEAAIAYARERFGGRLNVHYYARRLDGAELARLQPTRVMLAGLLHHLDDDDAVALLTMCAECPSVKRVATQDVVFLPGEWFSNLLARLDRGKHVRDVAGFRALAARAPLALEADSIMRCHPSSGRALYLLMAMTPRRAASSSP
jgi:SAM-dependent methyltransferase